MIKPYSAFLLLSTLFLLLNSFLCQGQTTTKNNYTGNWTDSLTWTDGVPASTTNLITATTINGYITCAGNLVLGNTNIESNPPDFMINDTLVITGDFTMGNKCLDLVINNGGVLIIMGTLYGNNKISLDVGGTLVVRGNFQFDGSNDDFTISGGNFYAFGTVSGNANAVSSAQPPSALQSSNSALYTFANSNDPTMVLPVILLNFEGKIALEAVNLSWTTTKEWDFDHFEVEHSFQSDNFIKIGVIPGKGNMETGSSYGFTHSKPGTGVNYYRLKAVDINGKFEYHKLLSVEFKRYNFKIYPNPATGRELSIHLGEVEFKNFEILDHMGKLVSSANINDNQETIQLNLTHLTSGKYFIKLFSETGIVMDDFIVYK
jgi:hypothetical protein